jgi:hypothetical protein
MASAVVAQTQNVAQAVGLFVSLVKTKLVKKSIRRQMLEMNGLVAFNKGLYHNQNYENLVKNIIQSRKAFRLSKDTKERKDIATEEIKQWKDYVEIRKKELTLDFQVTEKAENKFRHIFEIGKDRHTQTVHPSKVLDVYALYVKTHKFEIPVDPKNVARLVHPHYAYLSHFPLPFTADNLMAIMRDKIVSGFEEYNGQDLLSSEIAAYTYWNYFDKTSKGFMTVSEFIDLLKVFRISLTPNLQDLRKEFSFALSQFHGEFDRDIAENEAIVRFDFMRHIFLERNL